MRLKLCLLACVLAVFISCKKNNDHETPTPVPRSEAMELLLKLSGSNFNSGRLIADFGGVMPVKYLTPAEAAAGRFIYTVTEFQGPAEVQTIGDLDLKWEKTDGTIVSLGKKSLTIKRSVLTTINVTLPNGYSTGVNPVPTDTTWVDSESINW